MASISGISGSADILKIFLLLIFDIWTWSGRLWLATSFRVGMILGNQGVSGERAT
jgi:hypothetical protein